MQILLSNYRNIELQKMPTVARLFSLSSKYSNQMIGTYLISKYTLIQNKL